MVENPQAILGELGAAQLVAFVSFAIATVGFAIWVLKLWLEKRH